MTGLLRASLTSPARSRSGQGSIRRPRWVHWYQTNSSPGSPSYIEDGRQSGAKIAVGGNRVGNLGYFVQPTVLENTTPDMKVIREEIFGPVVCATPFDDDDLDAIAKQANDTIYGLAASVWTRNGGTAHKLASRIRSGTVWINCHNVFDASLPFGGYKQSGWGREMGAGSVPQLHRGQGGDRCLVNTARLRFAVPGGLLANGEPNDRVLRTGVTARIIHIRRLSGQRASPSLYPLGNSVAGGGWASHPI